MGVCVACNWETEFRITDMGSLKENMKQNCIPDNMDKMNLDDYLDFLKQRRVLMAKKTKKYYQSL